MTSPEGAVQMVLLFAVFLLAMLAALIAAEGLAEGVALLASFASRASDAGRMLASHAVDVAERTVANVAADRRNSAGLDLLSPISWRGTGVGTGENPGN
jgi:hypothetical protein